jgi:plasmid stability protein
MANLIVRNIDEEIVRALKERAGKSGKSAEAEHRKILSRVLLHPHKKSLIKVLAQMPIVGNDEDFERKQIQSEVNVFN